MLAHRFMPACAVIPELPYDDVVDAIQWLCEAFGLTEHWRAGSQRAQLAIADGAVALTEQRGSPVSHSVLGRVEAANSHYEHAPQHGARILQPPTGYPSALGGAASRAFAREGANVFLAGRTLATHPRFLSVRCSSWWTAPRCRLPRLEEVANTAAFVVSDHAGAMTGAVVRGRVVIRRRVAGVIRPA